MAAETRHAAWQTQYEVREVVGDGHGGGLAPRHRCGGYADAVEFALDYLDANDPGRSGAVARLTVERVNGSRRETIWSYDAADADVPVADPISVFGFDVTKRWEGPVYRAA